jgi:hypothetical protein
MSWQTADFALVSGLSDFTNFHASGRPVNALSNACHKWSDLGLDDDVHSAVVKSWLFGKERKFVNRLERQK